MQAQTQIGIRALIEADRSIEKREQDRLLKLLVERGREQEHEPDRIIRRAEAARRLAVTPRSVDYYGQRGILTRVALPGQSRANGYRESEIEALIHGERN